MSMMVSKVKASDEKEFPEAEAERKQACVDVERLLVRTTIISTITIKLYRFLILVRICIFVLFFKWRIGTPLHGGRRTSTGGALLTTASIAGELWFALMWVLDQLPKMWPVRHAADISALEESRLPPIDVFVTTADPEKEPPLATLNTVLSILAADYPVDQLACYVSDDGGALLTREALAEAARFARLWVPFCRKHGVEPRNPEAYFNLGGGAGAMRGCGYKGKAWPGLAHDRRRVQREYEELRARIDALQARDHTRRQRCWSSSPASDGCWRHGTAEDHAGVVQVLIGPPTSRAPQIGTVDSRIVDLVDLSSVDLRVPSLVYVCREKRPGRAHHRKAGAMNALLWASAVLSNAPLVLNLDCDHYVHNAQALRAAACVMLADDRGDRDVAFVQFPQRFDGVDPGDRYANHNRVFFDCTQLGLDGLQGPIYVGTGCVFRRKALYGADPQQSAAAVENVDPGMFGDSVPFLSSVRATFTNQPAEKCWFDDEASASIAEATRLVSCSFDEDSTTAWGRDMGWVYGTVTEDVATGFLMHRRGWRSAYLATAPDAFRGTAPINLTDRLHQVLRWSTGSLEIFFSRNNALLFSFSSGSRSRLHPLQRVAYLNTTVYPFTSVVLLVYCLFPAISSLLSGDAFSFSMDGSPLPATYVAFLSALMLTLATVAVLEARWSRITLRDWWRNQQFWMVSATSAYLAAVAQVALKIAAGKQICFNLTSKHQMSMSSPAVKKLDMYAELYAVRWTPLMVLPAIVLAMNLTSMVAVVTQDDGWWRNGSGTTVLGVAFNAWVLAHLYPFALGIMGRWTNAWRTALLLLLALFTLARLLYFVQQSSYTILF